jgi:hypothetical protein
MNIKEINKDFDREYDKYKNSPEYKAFAKQEPVAWMVRDQVDGCRYPSALKNPAGSINGESKPLYTAPPKREWVGLTEEEKQAAYLKIDAWSACVDFIETKLKEKNT